MKSRLKEWFLAILGLSYLVGSMLGLSIVYIFKGNFNIIFLLVAMAGALILFIINLSIVFLKKKKLTKNDSEQ